MTTVKFRLSETQMRKLASAHKNKTAVTLRLNKSMIAADGIPLTLTESEHKKIQSGNTHDIRISSSRIKKGGFLPLLAAAIPGIIGAISGITGIAKNIKDMTNKGKGLKRGGCGRGISLNPR